MKKKFSIELSEEDAKIVIEALLSVNASFYIESIDETKSKPPAPVPTESPAHPAVRKIQRYSPAGFTLEQHIVNELEKSSKTRPQLWTIAINNGFAKNTYSGVLARLIANKRVEEKNKRFYIVKEAAPL